MLSIKINQPSKPKSFQQQPSPLPSPSSLSLSSSFKLLQVLLGNCVKAETSFVSQVSELGTNTFDLVCSGHIGFTMLTTLIYQLLLGIRRINTSISLTYTKRESYSQQFRDTYRVFQVLTPPNHLWRWALTLAEPASYLIAEVESCTSFRDIYSLFLRTLNTIRSQ